jgi:hypothetical protein
MGWGEMCATAANIVVAYRENTASVARGADEPTVVGGADEHTVVGVGETHDEPTVSRAAYEPTVVGGATPGADEPTVVGEAIPVSELVSTGDCIGTVRERADEYCFPGHTKSGKSTDGAGSYKYIENACNECGKQCVERHSTDDYPQVDFFVPRICCSYACLKSYVWHKTCTDLDRFIPRPAGHTSATASHGSRS